VSPRRGRDHHRRPRLSQDSPAAKKPGKGPAPVVIAGAAWFFYRFVAASMSGDFVHPSGENDPYTAVAVFSLGLFARASLELLGMKKPFVGRRSVPGLLQKGTPRLHLIGVLGGVIWSIGMASASSLREPPIRIPTAWPGRDHSRRVLGRIRLERIKAAPRGTAGCWTDVRLLHRRLA